MTNLEFQVIKSWLQDVSKNTGNKVAEDLYEDNYSWIYYSELKELTGLDSKTLKGVIGSIIKKDWAFVDYDQKDLFCFGYSFIESLPKNKNFEDFEYKDLENL